MSLHICLHTISPDLAGQNEETFAYRIANCTLLADAPIPEFDSFRQTDVSYERCTAPAWPRPERPKKFRNTFSGTGIVANAERSLICSAGPEGYFLDIDSLGHYWVANDGRHAYYLGGSEHPHGSTHLLALAGPPLIIALALQDIWSLHASSVVVDNGAVVFLGESGAGKSTLAHFLAATDPDLFSLASDDLLPVTNTHAGVQAFPHFPQPKLRQQDQPIGSVPAQVSVRAIYLLMKSPSGSRGGVVTVARATPGKAAIALAGHTTASKLFDRNLLQLHLGFCTDVARSVQCTLVTYPHDERALSQMRAVVLRDLKHDPSA